MTEVLSPGAAHVGPIDLTTPLGDPRLLLDHLANVIQITLGVTRADLESYESFLYQGRVPETIDQCSRFISEPRSALYAQKDLIEAEQINGDGHLSCM